MSFVAGGKILSEGEYIMTLKEEAYAIIDKLPDKVMGDILKDLQRKADDPITWETPEQEAARKAKKREESMRAFLRLEEMRKEIQAMRKEDPDLIPDDYEEAYADSLAEKYLVAK